jgi:hypothetical protein
VLRSEVILSGNIGYPLPDGHVFSDSENDCGNWSYELCTGTVTRVYHNDTTVVRFWLICDGINSLNFLIFTGSLITLARSGTPSQTHWLEMQFSTVQFSVIKLPVKIIKFNEFTTNRTDFHYHSHCHNNNNMPIWQRITNVA